MTGGIVNWSEVIFILGGIVIGWLEGCRDIHVHVHVHVHVSVSVRVSVSLFICSGFQGVSCSRRRGQAEENEKGNGIVFKIGLVSFLFLFGL